MAKRRGEGWADAFAWAAWVLVGGIVGFVPGVWVISHGGWGIPLGLLAIAGGFALGWLAAEGVIWLMER